MTRASDRGCDVNSGSKAVGNSDGNISSSKQGVGDGERNEEARRTEAGQHEVLRAGNETKTKKDGEFGLDGGLEQGLG